MPFNSDIKKRLKDLDMGAVDHILQLDSSGFLDYIENTGATICGTAPIALQIEIMKNLKAKPELLKYYTSAEIMGDVSNSVSYVSLKYI